MPSSRQTALTLPSTCARSMTRSRIPCTLSSRVIGPSSHSGSLGRVSTLGKIGPMALVLVHGKCQHYSESGQTRVADIFISYAKEDQVLKDRIAHALQAEG